MKAPQQIHTISIVYKGILYIAVVLSRGDIGIDRVGLIRNRSETASSIKLRTHNRLFDVGISIFLILKKMTLFYVFYYQLK